LILQLNLTKVVSSNPAYGSLSVTCNRLVVFCGYSGFLHQ